MICLKIYRDRFDIVADILEIVKRKPKKTQIMYQANLSYSVLKKYLTEIIDNGLVYYNTDSRYYVLTDKGKELLIRYEEYSNANELVKEKMKLVKIKKESLKKLFNNKNTAFLPFPKNNKKI